jgi:hypothetical protein
MERHVLSEECPALGDSALPDGMGGTRIVTPLVVRDTVRAIAEWSEANGRLDRVVVIDAYFATHNGLSVGATLGALRSKYLGLTAGYSEEGVFVWDSTETGISYRLAFHASDAMRRPSDVNGRPELLPDTARVRTVVVSAQR